mmetsp:Transcript_8237/g.24437  ORF Transcript_8237/g.24437 Transcript_8237/m.24437 type:complete len:316 (-) Transcript_8237:36-983(-)
MLVLRPLIVKARTERRESPVLRGAADPCHGPRRIPSCLARHFICQGKHQSHPALEEQHPVCLDRIGLDSVLPQTVPCPAGSVVPLAKDGGRDQTALPVAWVPHLVRVVVNLVEPIDGRPVCGVPLSAPVEDLAIDLPPGRGAVGKQCNRVRNLLQVKPRERCHRRPSHLIPPLVGRACSAPVIRRGGLPPHVPEPPTHPHLGWRRCGILGRTAQDSAPHRSLGGGEPGGCPSLHLGKPLVHQRVGPHKRGGGPRCRPAAVWRGHRWGPDVSTGRGLRAITGRGSQIRWGRMGDGVAGHLGQVRSITRHPTASPTH